MKHVSDRFTVVLDANVLYPFLVRDVLLSFAHSGLYRARWTQAIIDELVSALIANKPDRERKIRQLAGIMAEQFPEALIEHYESLIPAIDLPDPDDRHVLAAAIKAGAHAIVTENLQDFPTATLASCEIEAHTADQFLQSTFQLYPTDAIRALREMRSRYINPPVSAGDLLTALTRNELVLLAGEVRPHFDFL